MKRGARSRSPTFSCLGFRWSVEADDPAFVAHVTSLYEACIAEGPAPHTFLVRREEAADGRLVSLDRDGHCVLRRASASLAIARVSWEVNRGVVEEERGRLLLHAAAAEHDGSVVIVSAAPGGGKSTLVAALVRAGLRYVTDEAVAVDPDTTAIAPYPKPLALDPRSPVFADLVPDADPGTSDVDDYLVPPRSISPDPLSDGGVPAIVLLGSYEPGRSPAARQVPRAEAAIALAAQSFNFESVGPGALRIVADVVRRSRCYRLCVDDLDTACRVVVDLLEDSPEEP